jgi:hypothetical protein
MRKLPTAPMTAPKNAPMIVKGRADPAVRPGGPEQDCSAPKVGADVAPRHSQVEREERGRTQDGADGHPQPQDTAAGEVPPRHRPHRDSGAHCRIRAIQQLRDHALRRPDIATQRLGNLRTKRPPPGWRRQREHQPRTQRRANPVPIAAEPRESLGEPANQRRKLHAHTLARQTLPPAACRRRTGTWRRPRGPPAVTARLSRGTCSTGRCELPLIDPQGEFLRTDCRRRGFGGARRGAGSAGVRGRVASVRGLRVRGGLRGG